MRTLLCFFALSCAACASTPPPIFAQATTTSAAFAAHVDCGAELPGFDKIAAPLVVLGEMHGQVGPPAFAASFACREALSSPNGATLALEVDNGEQTRIDAFLASDGGEQAKAALLDGHFWRRGMQDGRSSAAMLALLETVRGWTHSGLPLRVAAIDSRRATGQREAEQQLASTLVGLVKEKRGPVVVLTGNIHARTVPGLPWDPYVELMAGIAKRDVPDLIALDERSGAGDGWMCLTGDPNECGPKRVEGSAPAPAGTIELFTHPDELGFSGTYSVGAALASEPAIGATTAQKTATIIDQFRTANRPRMEDASGDSVLTLRERGDWCSKVMPAAQSHIALDGDLFRRLGPCEGTLTPAREHAVVPDVKIKFDLSFFFARPMMNASYDRESRTLFLPLVAAYEPWTDNSAVNHEWLHARHHLNARNGFTLESALMTYANDFTADEVPVILCDVIHGSPNPERLQRAEREVAKLRKQLDVIATLKKKSRQKHAGVAGYAFGGTDDGVERWVGGKDPKKSLAVLEGVWRDAATALLALKATPPDVATATSVPLLAGDACDPSR